MSSALFTTKQVETFLKEINSDDLKTMFGTSTVAIIKCRSQETLEEELTAYWDYFLQIGIGDIIVTDGEEYVVTCVYTDNSVDLLSKEGTKMNKGLYKVPYVVIGKLECFTV